MRGDNNESLYTLLTEVFTKKKGQELWPFLMEPTVNLVLMKSLIQIKLIQWKQPVELKKQQKGICTDLIENIRETVQT